MIEIALTLEKVTKTCTQKTLKYLKPRLLDTKSFDKDKGHMVWTSTRRSGKRGLCWCDLKTLLDGEE